MKKRLVLALLCAGALAFTVGAALDRDDYNGGFYGYSVSTQGILFGFTSTGLFDLIGGARFDNVTSATTLTITETNISLVGAVSISGSTSLYGAAIGIGYDVGAAMSIATTDTTGVMAITHAGSAPTMTWTIPVWSFVNSTSFAATSPAVTFTASTSDYHYTPDFKIGFDADSWLKIAVADTTGSVTITQTGTTKATTWTAAGGFIFGSGTPVTVTGTASTDVLTVVNGNVEVQDQFGLELTGGTVESTWNPASLNDGTEEAHEVTVTGASLGDFVLISSSIDVADLALVAQVTAADTVTAQLLNNTGGAIDLQTISLTVFVIPSTD